MAHNPTKEEIDRFCRSGGERPNAEWLNAMAAMSGPLCAHYEIDRTRWVYFCSQWAHECSGLSLVPMRENMRFRPERALEVYSYRIGKALATPEYAHFGSKPALAAWLCQDPDRLADCVYGGREGTPPGKGHLYIGRGPTQITHLNNYREIRDEIRKQPGGAACPDLVAEPTALELPEWGMRSAFADWHIKRLNKWADAGDIDNVSSVLNAGAPGKSNIVNGLASRRRWLARAGAIWPAEHVVEAVDAKVDMLQRGDAGEMVLALQTELKAKGYFPGRLDGIFGQMTEDAVVLFQKDHGLDRDGIAGPATRAALAAAPARDGSDRAAATVSTLREEGSRKIKAADGIDKDAAVAGTTVLALAGTKAAPDPDQISSWFSALKPVIEFLKANPQLVQVAVYGSLGYAGYRLFMAWRRSQVIKQTALEEYQTGAYRGR